MTKAEIVNEISLKTGTDRKEALQIVEGFMDSVKKVTYKRRECIFEGIRFFYIETPC